MFWPFSPYQISPKQGRFKRSFLGIKCEQSRLKFDIVMEHRVFSREAYHCFLNYISIQEVGNLKVEKCTFFSLSTKIPKELVIEFSRKNCDTLGSVLIIFVKSKCPWYKKIFV